MPTTIENLVTLRLYVQPKSAQNAIDDWVSTGKGVQVPSVSTSKDRDKALKVRVTAPPDKGKANAAVIKVLAKALAVPKSSLEITSGQISRTKMLLIHCAPDDITQRLEKLT